MDNLEFLSIKFESALQAGNRRQALRILHQACEIHLVDSSFDRKGGHCPSGPTDGAPLFDLTFNEIYPDDVYAPDRMRQYGVAPQAEASAIVMALIRNCEAEPNRQITIYRAVDRAEAASSTGRILPGTWVTPIRAYAQTHGISNLKNDFVLQEQIAFARDIYTSGDNWIEWGFHPQESLPEIPPADKLLAVDLGDLIHSWRGLSTTSTPRARQS